MEYLNEIDEAIYRVENAPLNLILAKRKEAKILEIPAKKQILCMEDEELLEDAI